MSEYASAGAAATFFGEFSLVIDGSLVQRWYGGRSRSLFQYLLVNRNKIVLKDRLYEVLWPHAEWSPYSSSLKVAVHALRQVLSAQQVGSGGCRLEVLYVDSGYQLKVHGDAWIDFSEFEALTAAGRTAERRSETEAAVRAYERAIDLYRGEFLPGENADWAQEQRAWYAGSSQRALHFLAVHAFRKGDDERALAYCRRNLEIDSCQEEAYRLIMLIHGRRGERSLVRQWYNRCHARLRHQLDVDPSAETTVLLRNVLSGSGEGLAAR